MTNPTSPSIEKVMEEINNEFMAIIKLFAPNSYAYLIDTDENDGEHLRESIREALQEVYEEGKSDGLNSLNEHLEKIVSIIKENNEKIDKNTSSLTKLL